MPDQIYIGNFAKGLKTNPLPFNIDNDAFPKMYNFYSWRGRARRKRGTIFLARLQRQISGSLVLTAGAGNLISGFGLQATSSITPGSISFVIGGNTYTEPTVPDGTLVGTPTGTGTINYATGAITITGGAGGTIVGTFSYFPGLPVMGLEDFTSTARSSQFPLLLAFDTIYSYQIKTTASVTNFYTTNFYKTTGNPLTWSGMDYQQFWTTNYSGALWATNNVPGLNLVTATITSPDPGTTITVTLKYPSYSTTPAAGTIFTTLIVGDRLWFNEFTSGGQTINGLQGTVSAINGGGSYDVTFAQSVTAAGNGIAQLLTSSLNSLPAQDGIRWYDGDPTSGTGLPSNPLFGWVNFAPPLTLGTVSIDNTPAALYYLVGALAILPFKDRLLFFAPWIQASGGVPIKLQDTVLWSWNGTPYYSVATSTTVSGVTTYTPGIVPAGETADPRAYYVDQTGFGGYLPAGISQPLVTISNNEDVLLIGFGGDGRKTRFVYTGNDLQPFLFFNINSELPSSATYSAVALDRGAIDIGQYGFAMTDQQSSQRIDLDIPDQVFQIQNLNNGNQRVNAIRDFTREWIYFSYPVNNSFWRFPTQTFLFNYRDNTWGILYENWTRHGNYRPQVKKSWLTTGFKSWNTWREPWNSGTNSPLYTNIIAGNPQGFVLLIGQGVGEGQSGNIAAIAASGLLTQITSIDHCVSAGDYLLFNSALGTPWINGVIGRVVSAGTASSPTPNTFTVDIPFSSVGPYLGLGVFTKLSQPLLLTKQFPFYWDQGRQLRLGVQKYLMDTTADGQVTVNIYLSQNPNSVWNDPGLNVPPNSLVYSQLMYTCPESANIGLTPANFNLQMPTAINQFQIWHRFNTSLIGDSVQIGITLNDAQMRNLVLATSEITLHGMHLTVYPSSHLA